LLAVGLASVQLLPTLQWVKESARDLNAIWPSFPLHQGLGFFSRDILRGPNSAGIFVPNAAAYVGMFTILAAAIGLLHPSRRYVIWFAALTIFGIAATFGLEPVHWVLTRLPVIKGLKNERLILLADFGLAALAALGVSMLQESSGLSSINQKMAWLLVALSFSFAFVGIYSLRMSTQQTVEFLRRPSFSTAMLLAGLIDCGLDYASGDAVVVMDADLQDPPELLPEMLALLAGGYGVVSAQRQRRDGETVFKRLTDSRNL
jgi:hypothetical protein